MSFLGGTTRIKQKIQIGSMGGRLDYGGDDRAFHKDDVPKRVRHHLSVGFTPHRCSDTAHPPTTDAPTHSPHLSPGSLHVGCTLLDHRFTPRQHTHSLSPPPPSPLAPPSLASVANLTHSLRSYPFAPSPSLAPAPTHSSTLSQLHPPPSLSPPGGHQPQRCPGDEAFQHHRHAQGRLEQVHAPPGRRDVRPRAPAERRARQFDL